jgi:hypothetical protein
MKKGTKIIITIVAVSIISVSIIIGYQYHAIYSWGADGELSLLNRQ